MKLNALLASFAIVAAGFAAPAMANTIGTITVSDQEWSYVAEYCEDLDGLSVSDAFDTEPSAVAELSTPNVNLASISQSDCQNAGLI
ncbi:hypothetical protein [Pelagibacterium halotolerans]|uniref:Uncharacterized protein n=1 Tax=Pelagibacterium halotolerans (strain DSM 22347 / JCM 15775 / CGMCC 1.7692 / B2) TaxID=1082931 RepID=G4RET0_PELHB|nr:hypothetical protein [Pelagibacterium halotolerans]AEQ51901.1 hypothetical protein KKY_1890 [Pelagibacterium halotolerans B2]QJR18297.1 hypothetical protein HKM20_07555 [Pelagibacterium halotolerans]SEA26478.1 hypothetical protein SAMN05428936_102523 [Pelagibacterium halotolerans]